MTDTKIKDDARKAMKDDARKAMFAAVGAPILVGKTVSEKLSNRFSEANTKATDFREKFLKDARSEFEKWATEGETLVTKLQDGEALEDLSHRIDVDQFQQQVGKLRTQLEDIIESWRSNFMPDSERATKVTIEVEAAPKTATKPVAKKPVAKKAAAKPAAKKAPAAKTATKPVAKKPVAKKPVAKKPVAKKAAAKPAAKKAPAAKTTAKPAAKKAPAAKTATKPAVKKTA